MPTFGTPPIGEARADSVTRRRAALLQEYVGYIQRVAPGQAGKLEPGEAETTQAIRCRTVNLRVLCEHHEVARRPVVLTTGVPAVSVNDVLRFQTEASL